MQEGGKNMRVLVTELIWPVGLERLRSVAEVEYDPELWKKRDQLLKKIKNADALIVRNQTKVDAELLQAGSHLKAIGRLGVGLDNIDLLTTRHLKINVVYARNANATSVAEYVMAAMLGAYRPLYEANRNVKEGKWDRKLFTGGELSGKTLGLIGAGEISHRVAKRAISFGMQVISYDPFVAPYDFVVTETGMKMVPFYDLLQQSDFISIHVPLNEQTRGMISFNELHQMKKSAYLINTSRGGIIDEGALFQVVQEKRIAGVFLDVLEEEPVDPQNPLLQCENVVITPHIAGLTEESQQRTSILVVEEIEKILFGHQALCIVH
jgi:D-3-phosphoglycerate dehydrogenase